MHLVRLATNVYMPELTIDQVLGYDIKNIDNKEGGASIRFLTANPGRIEIEGLDKDKSNKNLINMTLSAWVGDIVDSLKISKERIGYFITVGKNGSDAYRLANEIADSIKILTE